MDNDSVTILKYKVGTGLHVSHQFYVMDKFDEPDEVLRLDKMIEYSQSLSQMYQHYGQLWIKTCPIFPTRG